MSAVRQLVDRIRRAGCEIEAVDGAIRVSPPGVIDPALKTELSAQKDDVVRFLRGADLPSVFDAEGVRRLAPHLLERVLTPDGEATLWGLFGDRAVVRRAGLYYSIKPAGVTVVDR